MGRLVRGEVVILPFPYDDFSPAKRRPALVVAAPVGLSPVVAQITARADTDPYAVPLAVGDYATGGLTHDSFIRANILHTVKPTTILYSAGTITDAKL